MEQLEAYNCLNMDTLDWLADSGAGRNMANDVHDFFTKALDTLTQVAYGDDHVVPVVLTETVTLPVGSGNAVFMEVLFVLWLCKVLHDLGRPI